MDSFKANLPHLLMATVVIAAASTLAALGVITGGEALGVIGTAAGFSMGAGGASTSLSTAANAMPALSSSNGTSTVTVTPHSQILTPAVTPTPTT